MTKSQRPRKGWREKLDEPAAPVVKRAPHDFAGMRAGQIMLVPTARMINRFIRRLPAGTSMDVRRMRALLAKRHGAEVTCPIYTGFHLRTVAEAAFEDYERGVALDKITPFWRVIDSETPTAPRLTCGIEFLLRRRHEEGLEP